MSKAIEAIIDKQFVIIHDLLNSNTILQEIEEIHFISNDAKAYAISQIKVRIEFLKSQLRDLKAKKIIISCG